MSKDVHGWCISRDSSGIPTIEECSVMRGAVGKYFVQAVDSGGDWITVRTYQRGESFFTDKQAAIVALLWELEAVKLSHQMAIAYIEDQIDMAKQVLELERAKCRR